MTMNDIKERLRKSAILEFFPPAVEVKPGRISISAAEQLMREAANEIERLEYECLRGLNGRI